MANIEGSKQAKDIREILNKRYPGQYRVRGSTPYEKGCIILKVTDGKKYFYKEYPSNKEAYAAISNINWGKDEGLFKLEECGEYPEKHVWNIVDGCFITILENLALVVPERVLALVYNVKKTVNKFNPYKK